MILLSAVAAAAAARVWAAALTWGVESVLTLLLLL
jgi:hypothetical protein